MAKNRLAHICVLVRDIDQAINHYKNILSAVAPDLLEKEVTKEENFAGKDRYVTAFFSATGDGCDIQLLQPLDPESPLYKRLEENGEGLHHIAFSSSQLEETFRVLQEKGVALHGDEFVYDPDNPELRWAWARGSRRTGYSTRSSRSFKGHMPTRRGASLLCRAQSCSQS
jgi:catechol 2,3-dioxygenase-like lactoylglutathione lyase family enzyme